MKSTTVRGTTIHYIDQGRGLPIVLLHGFPLSSAVWEEQIDHLSSRYRVIAPDLCGFGQSRSDNPFTIDSLAAAMHALIQELGAEPCVLGGLSMGGYVALSYSRKCPAKLAGMVLIDTRAAGDSPDARQNRSVLADRVLKEGPQAAVEAMLDKMVSSHTLNNRPQVVEKLKRMMLACPPRTIANALLAMRDREDQSDFLPSIADPTLIIVGEQDAITPPAMAEAMHRAIPRSKLIVIPDAGHMTPLEAPQQLNAALEGFLSGLS